MKYILDRDMKLITINSLNFVALTDLPTPDLMSEFVKLNIQWPDGNQICLNTVVGYESDYEFGCGSLSWDWANQYAEIDEDGSERIIVPKRPDPYQEDDFNILCTQFVGTLFEDVYKALDQRYHLGRVRLMRSMSRSCLSWHIDDHPRVHYPIKTQEGCLMVIENESYQLPNNTWWWTNTLLNHTAVNASMEDRIHLVATIVGVK